MAPCWQFPWRPCCQTRVYVSNRFSRYNTQKSKALMHVFFFVYFAVWQKGHAKELHENFPVQGRSSAENVTEFTTEQLWIFSSDVMRCPFIFWAYLCWLRFLGFQMDVISLVPLELFYFKTGINPLLRFPRLLKARLTCHLCGPPG